MVVKGGERLATRGGRDCGREFEHPASMGYFSLWVFVTEFDEALYRPTLSGTELMQFCAGGR